MATRGSRITATIGTFLIIGILLYAIAAFFSSFAAATAATDTDTATTGTATSAPEGAPAASKAATSSSATSAPATVPAAKTVPESAERTAAPAQETPVAAQRDVFPPYEESAAPDSNKALALWGTGGASAVAGFFLFGMRKRERRRERINNEGAAADALLPYGTAQRLIGILLIAAAVGIFIGVLYYQNRDRGIPLVFSARSMLRSLWVDYKQTYIEPGSGRTIDKQRDNITTSEGQSYTMLRAVWLDDKQTFDKSWEWTRENLQRDDHLFSWLYGVRKNGERGILSEQGGRNSASDADTDIALALLFAHTRWGDETYLEAATPIIQSIWEKEVVIIKGVPYMAANDLEKKSKASYVIVNPSYLAPYAYRIFSTVDAKHPWMELVDSSYRVIAESSSLPLDKKKSANLPPDWVLVNRTTGALSAAPALSSDYGFDAMRVPFRMALDYAWFGEPRAKETLSKFEFLTEEWTRDGALSAIYAHDGATVMNRESPAFYGGAVGYFKVADEKNFRNVSRRKLSVLYNPDIQAWKAEMSYYDDNWAWFGLALAHDALPNLGGPLARAAR